MLDIDQVIAIELQDSAENIFKRLVFSDEVDKIYYVDEYKEQHKEYYMKDIQEEIKYAKNLFRKIENKYFMNNQSVDQVVNGLTEMFKISAQIIELLKMIAMDNKPERVAYPDLLQTSICAGRPLPQLLVRHFSDRALQRIPGHTSYSTFARKRIYPGRCEAILFKGKNVISKAIKLYLG